MCTCVCILLSKEFDFIKADFIITFVYCKQFLLHQHYGRVFGSPYLLHIFANSAQALMPVTFDAQLWESPSYLEKTLVALNQVNPGQLSSCSTVPLLRTPSATTGCWASCPVLFEYLQRWSLSGERLPVFSHPHSKGVFLLRFKLTFLCFSLCPSLLVLSLGTTQNSVAPFSLLCRYLYMLIRSPWAFSSSGWRRGLSASPQVTDAPVILSVFVALHWTHASVSISLLY